MSVTVKLGKYDRLNVNFYPFTKEHIQKIKTLRGSEWNPTERYWSMLLCMENLQQLENLFDGERFLYDEGESLFRPYGTVG